MWPFRAAESRASDTDRDYSQKRVDAFEEQAAGLNADVQSIAVAQACIGLWERSIASADVLPISPALRGVTPAFLALLGRSLAVYGELVAHIRVADGGVVLYPATVQNLVGDSRTWRYLISLTGPSTTEALNVGADEVLHFRVNVDKREPWRGRGALQRASGSARLLCAIEAALTAESKLPVGRIGALLRESGTNRRLRRGAGRWRYRGRGRIDAGGRGRRTRAGSTT